MLALEVESKPVCRMEEPEAFVPLSLLCSWCGSVWAGGIISNCELDVLEDTGIKRTQCVGLATCEVACFLVSLGIVSLV